MRETKVIKKIVFLTALMAIFSYWLWRQNNPLDLGEIDYWYVLLICPMLIFGVSYIVSKGVFCLSVCAVYKKGIRIIFIVELAALGMYAVSLLLFAGFSYGNFWLEHHYIQAYYSWLLMFCGSSQGAVFCAFTAVLLALAVTGKELLNGSISQPVE